MRKRKVPAGGRAGTGGNASVGGGGMSSQGDDLTGNITFDEHGRPVQGGVGSGLVPGSLPQNRGAAGSVAGQSIRTYKN